MLAFPCRGTVRKWLGPAVIATLIAWCVPLLGYEGPIYPMEAEPAAEVPASQGFDLVLLADEPVKRPLEQGTLELVKDPAGGKASFLVRGHQAGMRIEEPAFVTPKSTVRWSWKKDKGTVVIVQIGIRNPETGQHRYLGYGAGALSEPPSGDPTVELFVDRKLPQQWTVVERALDDDIKKVLGWESAQIVSFFASPWDGEAGSFRDARILGVTPTNQAAAARQAELHRYSRIGKGQYIPQRLKRPDEQHVAKFETSFEECAPTRNSAANEWSAFGAIGNMDFNCMGRDLWVRYPVFDLVFRLYEGDREIEPGQLPSFRLGLVNDRMPGIWGGWQHEGLLYKVSVMTIPDRQLGNFDLYKLEIQNRTDRVRPSKLVAGVDGPPDVRLQSGVVRGLGDAPFAVADPPQRCTTWLRDWGLCDKRAKAYRIGPGPGKAEEAIGRYRVGLDGTAVVYRVKADRDKRYVVYVASTPHISGYHLAQPKKSGDLVFEYRAEGCEPKTLDWHDWVAAKPQPLCVGFDEARDVDGDGYLEVRSGVTSDSPIRHTRLSAIYVFPEKTRIDNLEAVYSGAMNDRCVCHIDVGATPEQDAANQHYDRSDVGFARLKLAYGGSVGPGQTKTFWLRVPSIHRREPVSMGYMAHAFRDVLPGEAVPPCSAEYLQALQQRDPREFEGQFTKSWNEFFARAASIEVPDRVLTDIYLSRLATRAILDVPLNEEYSYNTCSPFFYFDHAYRDQAYVIYGLDLAGMHDRAEKLLRVYCKDMKDVPKGLIAFDGKPVQLGMHANGLWNTRPGQWDTQGENIWALVQHYKLSGDRAWLEKTAYPYIQRGAQWLVNSRHKHMDEVKDPNDPRYGLLEPGAMEVIEVGKGMHMYYLNGFGILGLREAADAAAALGRDEDARQFAAEALDLKKCLYRSFAQTFKRTGLYEGHLWFGVEPEGVGMYGFWAHNCLIWPCRSIDPRDPMVEATWRRMESMSNQWGGGMHSEGQGSFWPYIGVDRAVSHILRNEPERALDYFCAYTDTAGGTLSWGEGYANLIAGGDQPHFWADGQWLNLYRQLFAFEDGSSLWLTPALFRRWHEGDHRVALSRLPTHFGDLDLRIEPRRDGSAIRYTVQVEPKGDQAARKLEKIVLYPRVPGGRAIERVVVDGQDFKQFTRDCIILAEPRRGKTMEILVEAGSW